LKFGVKSINIHLSHIEPSPGASAEELSKIVLERLGLGPRKKGSTEKMHTLLMELYERAKTANREKNPSKAVISVEEMASYAGISRQTMYDYLGRWTNIDVIKKVKFLDDKKVTYGYMLNGNTLEQAFEKVHKKVNDNLKYTSELIDTLQKAVKNEKISEKMLNKTNDN